METLVLGLRVLLALACVIGLIWVLARRAGWGKGRRRPAGPVVEVIGRHAFGRHAGVAVVAVGDRRLLLGYGEQNVTMLTELDPAEAADAADPVEEDALAAAVLPRQRGARTTAPAAVPSPGDGSPEASFDAALARAASTGGSAGVSSERADMLLDDVSTVSTSSGDTTPHPTGPASVRPVPASAVATAATAAASASASAALAAAASIPVAPVLGVSAPSAPAGGTTSSSDVPGLAGMELADVDPAHLPGLDRAVGETAEVRPGALHGSVLAPSTWKQAVAALRERTVRR